MLLRCDVTAQHSELREVHEAYRNGVPFNGWISPQELQNPHVLRPMWLDGSRGVREFHRPCLTHGREGQWANVQAEHRTPFLVNIQF